MELSYWLRLLCWMMFSLGLLQFTFDILGTMASRMLQDEIAVHSARWQERCWFALPLASHLAATLITLGIILPGYLLHEVNDRKEHVGWVCLAGALMICMHYAQIAVRGARLAWRMHSDHSLVPITDDTGAELSENVIPLLAVKGILRPRIAISPDVARGDVFSHEALGVAIAHERSHVQQHDNLKLFLLSSLSHAGQTGNAVQRWRRAAERAADDDAVAGNRTRAVLLAEALVTAARAVSTAPATLGMELMPFESELEERVNRLLEKSPLQHPHRISEAFRICLVLAGVVALALPILIAASHEFAEFMFRLG